MPLTTDKTDYATGENIVCTITGHSETPNAATINAVAETIQGGATSSSATVTGVPLADFGVGQPHQLTPWGQLVTLVLSFPTEADEQAEIRISPSPLYPVIPMLARIRPENGGKFTRTASGGAIHTLDLNAVNTYAIEVFHDRLEAAERDQVIDLWNANGISAAIYIDPLTDPYKYVCRFNGEPEREPRSPRLFDVTSQLKGVRL